MAALTVPPAAAQLRFRMNTGAKEEQKAARV